MANIKLQDQAYSKLLLHCAKFPWSNVFGLLLCDAADVNQIVDVIPVFHSPIVTPVLQVAVVLVAQHCEVKKLKICGGYYCGESSAVAKKAVSQICAKSGTSPLLLVVEKDKISRDDLPFTLDGSDIYKNSKLQLGSTDTVASFLKRLKDGREASLVDFEDSLEDVSLDFRNPSLLA